MAFGADDVYCVVDEEVPSTFPAETSVVLITSCVIPDELWRVLAVLGLHNSPTNSKIEKLEFRKINPVSFYHTNKS